MEKEVLDKIPILIAMNQEGDSISGNHILLNGKVDDNLMETINNMDVLVYRCSASNINPEGIRGFHFSDMLEELVEKANTDMEKAQRAVVIIEDFEQMSTDERFIEQLPIDETEAELEARIESEKMRRRINQLSLTAYLSGVVAPVMNDELFDTSCLTFILVGDYKYLSDDEVMNGYDLGIQERIVPIMEKKENKSSNKTSKKYSKHLNFV